MGRAPSKQGRGRQRQLTADQPAHQLQAGSGREDLLVQHGTADGPQERRDPAVVVLPDIRGFLNRSGNIKGRREDHAPGRAVGDQAAGVIGDEHLRQPQAAPQMDQAAPRHQLPFVRDPANHADRQLGGRIPRRRRQSALDRPRERAVGQDGHATRRHQARRYLQPPGDRHDERGAAHADLGGIRTRQVADRRRSGFPVQEQPELPDPGQAQQMRREGFSAHRLVPDLPAQDHLRLPASRSCARWLFARNARACGGSPSRDRARSSGRRCRP